MKCESISLLSVLLTTPFWSLANGQTTERTLHTSHLPIFREAHPRTFVFRTPQRVASSLSKYRNDPEKLETIYTKWAKSLQQTNGLTVKFLREEIQRPEFDILGQFVRRFAKENPDKLVMNHFNARARDPNYKNRFSPGHWLYYPGTNSTAQITSSDKTIHVQDTSIFRTDIGLKNTKKWQRRRKINDDLVLVPLDKQGQKQWSLAEHAVLESINNADNTITVVRGQYGTHAKDLEAGFWIAPHVTTGPWDRDQLWAYNYNQNGVKDDYGLRMIDILVKDFKNMVAPGGELHYIRGITFDLLQHRASFGKYKRQPDINNDGIADQGIINGVNYYGLGVHEFLTELRNIVGPEFILTADGNTSNSQRAVGLLNGIESEGIGSWNDAYRAWPNTFNALRYWKRHSRVYPPFYFVVPKQVIAQTFPSKTNSGFQLEWRLD